jgi:hypothetical protein
MTSSIIQPSYASAVPTIDTIRPPLPSVAPSSSSSSSSAPPPTEQVMGSSFLFKLRQLSGGDGQSEVSALDIFLLLSPSLSYYSPLSQSRIVYEHFYTELHMINSLFNISTALMSISLDGAHKLKEVRGELAIPFLPLLYLFFSLLFILY